MRVDLNHPANARIIAFLLALYGQPLPEVEGSRSPDSFAQPHFSLGTHPDIVERFWNDITNQLPEPCAWVAYRRPVLVHPRTGIIFGFATGTHTYALRLPPPELQDALLSGAKRQFYYNKTEGTLDLTAIGEDWVFGGWFKDEPRWCLAAYNYAGETDSDYST